MIKTLFILQINLFISLMASAQTSFSEDFETQETQFNWFADDCFIDKNFPNPKEDQDNLSKFVLLYEDIGGNFANIGFDYEPGFNLSAPHEFSIWIYVPSSSITGNSPNQLSLKLQNKNLGAPWSTQTEIIKTISLDKWQQLKFNFNTDSYINLDPNSPQPRDRSDLNRLLLQVNGENNTNPVRAYFDNFSFTSETSEVDEPVFDKLVWQDEFNYTGAVDNTKWFHQTQLPAGGSWFNGEIQHYTDRIENAEVSEGTLKIRAKAEGFTDQGITKNYTSARLNSKYAFTYGKVEIRAKLPSGVGTWPAMWTLGQNIDEDGAYWDNQGFDNTSWPACGELDIMEHWGDNQDHVSSAIHTPSSFGGTVNTGGQNVSNASSEFHTYTMIWTDEYVKFSVDGVSHYTYNPPVKDASTWPFDAPQYIIFNIAILPNIQTNFIESSLEIDYIRIYQTDTLSIEDETISEINTYPNPVKDKLAIDNTNIDTFELYNTTGVLVKKGKVNDKYINFSELSPGVYIIKLKNRFQKSFTKRLIKN